MPDGKPEIYLACQGEGATVGLPLVFVRLSTCNLHCRWCDTYYTWNFEGTKFNVEHDYAPKVNVVSEQMEMSVEEVANAIRKAGGINHNVVFTGGEPMVQQKDIIRVINILRERDADWYFEIETNGTIMPTTELHERLNRYNCSPKLESSGNQKFLRDQPNVMGFLQKQAIQNRASFKYVITKQHLEKDIKEIDSLVKKYHLPKRSVFLMPEGIETQSMIEWSKEVAEICKQKGYSLSTRMQVILYGPKRAV